MATRDGLATDVALLTSSYAAAGDQASQQRRREGVNRSGWNRIYMWQVALSVHATLERWAPAAEWGVALGTALLASATFLLAQQAKKDRDRGEARKRADSLLVFVGHAANTSSLYQVSFPALREVLQSNADPAAMIAAEADLDRAEVPRQSAYAALFRVEAEFSGSSHEAESARAFMAAIDRQREAATRVLAWAANPGRITHPSGWPPVRNVREPTVEQRDACLMHARKLVLST